MRGRIANWIDAKGFGFVTPDQPSHPDVFLRENELPAHVRKQSARVGLIIEFDPVDAGKSKMAAKHVTVLECT